MVVELPLARLIRLRGRAGMQPIHVYLPQHQPPLSARHIAEHIFPRMGVGYHPWCVSHLYVARQGAVAAYRLVVAGTILCALFHPDTRLAGQAPEPAAWFVIRAKKLPRYRTFSFVLFGGKQ